MSNTKTVCNRSCCKANLEGRPVWWNHATKEFYCTPCARKLNEANPGPFPLCIEYTREIQSIANLFGVLNHIGAKVSSVLNGGLAPAAASDLREIRDTVLNTVESIISNYPVLPPAQE